MQDISNSNKTTLIIIIFLIIISYAAGFAFNENSSGGSPEDFVNTKKNIAVFNDNSFYEAIKLTATKDNKVFQSTRTPGFYIFNKYLNPFTDNISFFQGYLTVFSLLIPILLFMNLKIKFKDTNVYFLMFTSSLILLSPYLRSSAFWGNEENFGIVMVGFSALFYQLYKEASLKKYQIFYLILLALFSSLCVYSDQKLIIIPFISLIFVMILEKKKFNKLFLIFLYILFSIPFIYLIKLWGNITPSGDGSKRHVDIFSLVLNYQHVGYSFSIVAFYLFPFLFLLKNIKKEILIIFKNKINFLFGFFIFFYLIYYLSYYDLESFYLVGGGIFHKLTRIIFDNVLLQKISMSIIFLFSWLIILLFSVQNF